MALSVFPSKFRLRSLCPMLAAALVAALTTGASPGDSKVPRAVVGSASSAVRALVTWLQGGDRSAPASASQAGAGEIVCGARVERPLQFPASAGLGPLPWAGPVPRTGAQSAPTGMEEEAACSAWVYRRFFAGRDTVSFTYGHSAEECSDVPRLILQSGGRARERIAVPPLDHRNVECLWATPHYLIFGLVYQGEGGPEYDRIACWRIGSQDWIWTQEREGQEHRPGFDLASLLPDWRTANAAEVGDAVEFRGKERALALWPRERSWSLVDAASGAAIPVPRRTLTRVIVEGRKVHLHPVLASQIQSEFRKRNRAFDPFEVLEMITEPCRAHRASRALIAHAIVHGAADRGVQDHATGKFRWQDEMFGVFLVDSTLTRLQATLGMFPTERWLDETAYFDTEAPDDSIVVWPESVDYGGDLAPSRSFPCAP